MPHLPMVDIDHTGLVGHTDSWPWRLESGRTMNIVPSIVASGVAQTPLQAQQIARRRAARAQQEYRQTRMVQEVAEVHLNALDENDEGSAGVHLRINSDLPDHPSPEMPMPTKNPHQGDVSSESVQSLTTGDDPAPDDPAAVPIRHVDVKA